MNEDVLTEHEQVVFKDWLELSINNITWEGRYINEFNSFWEKMFPQGIKLASQFRKLEFARTFVKSGPLVAWFQWLKEKLVCYLFLYKGFTIKKITEFSGFKEAEVALILRSFFVERFPHLEEEFNEKFQLSFVTCDNTNITFEKIIEELSVNRVLRGSLEDDVLKSLEVTLYDDWVQLNENLNRDIVEQKDVIDKVKKSLSFKKQVKFFQELILLFIIGGALIFAVKVGNKWYEDYLVKKITLFEPNFFWLDKNLSFKAENPLSNKEVELSYKELENLEKLESDKVFDENIVTAQYTGESDVVLTSVDSLPKDFNVANMEQSSYEEKRKGGYRDMRYGRRRAYRIMMTSVSPRTTKKELVDILKKYKVKQVDNVKPGKEIPGGIYFNLYVPRKIIKEFLSHVSSVEESTILESKTVFGGPAGTNKVFIWIKSI
jgi:hypothetical protein